MDELLDPIPVRVSFRKPKAARVCVSAAKLSMKTFFQDNTPGRQPIKGLPKVFYGSHRESTGLALAELKPLAESSDYEASTAQSKGVTFG
jgi:hypothetical protein